MNFSHYISISVIFHLTLTLLIGTISMYNEPSFNLFNVDIVSLDPVLPEKPEESASIPEQIKKPVLVKKRRSISADNIQPDALFDDINSFRHTENTTSNAMDASDQSQGISQNEALSGVDSSNDSDASDKGGVDIIPPSALFDRKTIQKFASKAPAQNNSLTFDVPEFRHRGYMRLLKDKIERIWKYPGEAARHGRSGDLYIEFSIKRDGSLGTVEVIRTSGFRELDEAAVAALKEAQPYWPLPDSYEGDTLDIRGHFIYIFGSTYLM